MIYKVLENIKILYNTKGGELGGYGHIVFDDGNIEDEFIIFCLEEAKQNKHKDYIPEKIRLLSINLLELFLKLSYKERKKVYDIFWNY